MTIVQISETPSTQTLSSNNQTPTTKQLIHAPISHFLQLSSAGTTKWSPATTARPTRYPESHVNTTRIRSAAKWAMPWEPPSRHTHSVSSVSNLLHLFFCAAIEFLPSTQGDYVMPGPFFYPCLLFPWLILFLMVSNEVSGPLSGYR